MVAFCPDKIVSFLVSLVGWVESNNLRSKRYITKCETQRLNTYLETKKNDDGLRHSLEINLLKLIIDKCLTHPTTE